MEKEGGRDRGRGWQGDCMHGRHDHTHTVPDYTQGSQGPPLTGECPTLSHGKKDFTQLSGMSGGTLISPVAAWFNSLQAQFLLLMQMIQ